MKEIIKEMTRLFIQNNIPVFGIAKADGLVKSHETSFIET